MINTKKILSEVAQLKALGQTMIDRASSIEAHLLAGEGTKPASTRKGEDLELLRVLANRNKTLQRKRK